MNVEPRMTEVIRSVLHDDDLVLTDDTTAQDVDGWDSLAHITIMYTLESEFAVQFSDEQLNSFRNVGELRRFLREATDA